MVYLSEDEFYILRTKEGVAILYDHGYSHAAVVLSGFCCVNASQSATERRAASLPRLAAGLRRQACAHSGQRKNDVSRARGECETV